MKIFKFLLPSYFLVVIFLFLYSFTQIDLSLTLSRISIWQGIQKYFQHIGYFDRPLSTFLFFGILLLLFIFYGVLLSLAKKGKLSIEATWQLIIGTAVILFLSYNAFSYDIFNYIFDAKVITHYHLSPYLFKALDFPKDPMLSFMHSTHRTYPYGPAWLGVSLVPSFLGMNIFLVTFYLFKLIAVASYLGSAYVLSLIAKKEKMNEKFVLIFAMLNPLVIIESLVSAHNEMTMIFLALTSIYFLMQKKKGLAILFLLLSIAIKYTTLFLIPIFLLYLFMEWKKKPMSQTFLFHSIAFVMCLAVIATSLASGQNKNPEIQPWYFVSLIPFVALIKNHLVKIITFCVSLGIMLSYVPFLLNGQWPADIVQLKIEITALSIGVGLIVYFITPILSRGSRH